MKITIEKNESGIHVELGSNDWDHYEVIGMLEETKRMVQQEIDRMRDAAKKERPA